MDFNILMCYYLIYWNQLFKENKRKNFKIAVKLKVQIKKKRYSLFCGVQIYTISFVNTAETYQCNHFGAEVK